MARIAVSSFVLFAAVVLTALLFRRSFCGNVCAFGALQEFVGKLRRLFTRKKRFTLPRRIDRAARFLKYGVLVFFIYFTWRAGELVIRPYDPWVTYHHILSADLFAEFLIGFCVLIVSLIGSVFYDRFFCKYLCPMGAFLGLINRAGLFRVERNDETCIHCGKCDQACPVNIKVEAVKYVQSSECLNCHECVNGCPVEHTLFVSGPGKVRIGPKAVMGISIVLFVIVVAVASVTGGFAWSTQSIAEMTAEGRVFNPDDIKGRDTFLAVAEASGVPLDVLRERFSLTEAELSQPIREVAGTNGREFDTDEVREFVREYVRGAP